jgi:hypothetical protein
MTAWRKCPHPHIFGWMVHVYPYEKDPKKIWSTDDDDQGHDNMDHSATRSRLEVHCGNRIVL